METGHVRVSEWTEFVGELEKIGKDIIVLKVPYTIRISKGNQKKLKTRIQKGQLIGILFLKDGRARVRILGEG